MAPDCSFNELQQLQLRAQILVYGALAQGSVPEEALMVGAFSDTSTGLDDCNLDDGRIFWEGPWLKALDRFKGIRTGASQGRAKLNTWRPSSTPSLVDKRPTATRTLLQGFQTDRQHDSPLAEPEERAFVMHEQQTRLELESAESMSVSILDHCQLLHDHLRQQFSVARPQPQVISAAFAMEAAASAAKAAVGAARVAYEAVSQALTFTEYKSNPPDGSDVEGVSHAVGLVFTAVFQAQTALSCGSRPWFHSESKDNSSVQAQFAIEPLKQDDLREGVRLEVMPEQSGVWRAAKVLAVHEGIVHVLYDSDDGSCSKEWIPIHYKSAQRPRLRLPYPKSHAIDKLSRTWISGDLVDVRIANGWREGIVTSVSKNEDNTIVFFPGDGHIHNSKACDLRPSLLWQDKKWVHGLIGAHVGQDAETLDASIAPEDARNTGPPTSYKMKNLIDVITKEVQEQRAGEKKRDVKPAPKKSKEAPASKVPSKVRKAKELIEKATQVSKARGRVASGHQMLREMLKASSRKRYAATEGLQQRPQRRKQPTTKLLEGLQSSGKQLP